MGQAFSLPGFLHQPHSAWRDLLGRGSCFCALLCTIGVAACCWAAGNTGALAGAVLEADGTPAALAGISVIQMESGFHRNLVAGPHGKYRLAELPAGSYIVAARSPRSGAMARVTAVVDAGGTSQLTITLSPTWNAAEARDVRAALLLQGNYLDALRNASEITRGEEGGNIEGYTVYSPRGNSSFNSVGQRGQDNNFLIDGMDNNESWVRGAVLMPPADVVESVSLYEVTIPAAIGHTAGGSVNVQTPAGSNQFHGSAFDYLQNSALDARNFFDGAHKPGLVQNQFGASAGGAIRPNDWFYFVNAEALRGHQGLTVISTVPTVAQKAGNFGSTPIYDPLSITEVGENAYARQLFPGNQVPASRIFQPARNLIGLYPDPNLPGAADNYRFTPNRVENTSWASARTDKILSPRSTLFARISYQRDATELPGALPAPDGLAASLGPYAGSDPVQHADGSNTHLTAWGGGVSHTFMLRPDLINEFRVAVSRFDLNAAAADQGINASAALRIPGLSADGLPLINPEGFTALGAAEPAPLAIRTTSYQLEDSASWKTARHTWQFGFQAIRRQADGDASEWSSRGDFQFTPDYTSQPAVGLTGDSIASLLTGYPTEVMRNAQFSPFHLQAWEWTWFGQDEFHLTKSLTIQAGLNYSLYPPLTEAENRLVNFNFSRTTPGLDQFASQNGVNPYAGLSYNKRTLAPRVGFAWDVFGTGGTVVRGGFSKDYDTGTYIAEGMLAQNPPYASRLDRINGTFQLGPNLTSGLPAPQSAALLNTASLNGAQGSIYAIEPQSYTPYADQWGLFVEQRLRPRLTLEMAGMGSMGIHLYETYDANQPYPAPTPFAYVRYPYYPYTSRIEYLAFAGGSTYYGGQVKLTGQLAPGLQVLATYRYAKSLDDSTAPGSTQDSRPSTPQYIYNLRGNRSPSPFDIAQRLLLTASYDLPFHPNRVGSLRTLHAIIDNWRASTVVTAQTGFPFTPQLAVNSLNNGGYQLPDRLGAGSLPAGQRSYLQWFNTSLNPADPNRAFAVPVVYQYGNSGFDILRGPGLTTVDASLARSFSLTERLRLETRVDAFNFLNQANFALPNRILGVESAGVISHTSTPARQIQLLARIDW